MSEFTETMNLIEQLKVSARIEAQMRGLSNDLVLGLMLKGATIALEGGREIMRSDRLKAEHGPGSESIPATQNPVPKRIFPVHPLVGIVQPK